MPESRWVGKCFWRVPCFFEKPFLPLTGFEENRVLNREFEDERVWDPTSNQALARLLDHIAEELAYEYIRLMEAALDDGAVPLGDTRPAQE